MFAYRAHSAFVNLSPGESLWLQLPPTTQGVIQVEAKLLLIGGTDLPGDHPQGGTSSARAAEDGPFGPRTIDELRAGRAVLESRKISVVPQSAQTLALSRDDGGVGGTPVTGAAAELVLELLHGVTVVQTKENGQNILFDSPSSSGNTWSLRITRKSDGSVDRRRYRIGASYPSVLPIEERRIPLRFLQRGLDANWNDGHQYLEDFWIENNIIHYRWDAKLAQLYDLTRDNSYDIGYRDYAEIPYIRKVDIRFDAGYMEATPDTGAGPYLGLTITVRCRDSRVIDIIGPDDITLPEQFSIEMRAILRAFNGILMIEPWTKLSHDIEDSLYGFDFDLPGMLNGFGTYIVSKQWNEYGQNKFDRIVRPWLAGHVEVVDVGFERATETIIIRYVGDQLSRPIALATDLDEGDEAAIEAWRNLVPLFADADDEKWGPVTGIPEMPFPRPATTTAGALDRIEHFVILQQENRSFDQILGYLSRDAGHAEVEGLLPGDNDRDVNRFQREGEHALHDYRSRLAEDTSWPFTLGNPCHGHVCVADQISDGMKSFVADYARRLGPAAPREDLQRIMDYHNGEQLPVYAELVRQFAICDHWFCSHIGGTLPNRHIMLSGDLNRDRYGLPEEENSDFKGYAPSERPTFFDHLTERGISWKLFEHGYSFLRLYRNFTFDTQNIVGFEDDDLGFAAMAQANSLPSVSFIEPDYIEAPDGNDDHAPADMFNGQILIAKIVRALIRSNLWEKSMLIITYDEHGGFYDHLVPPSTIAKMASDGTISEQSIPPLSNGTSQLGVRVPAFVISPLIDAGPNGVNVCKTVFEHTSIAATILRAFCSPRPPVMPPRVTKANDLRELITRDTPRPRSDFASTLQIMDSIAMAPQRAPAGARPTPVPIRKIASPDAEEYKEDFHGFIAYASAITGRGRS